MNEGTTFKTEHYSVTIGITRPYRVFYVRGDNGVNYSIGFLAAKFQGKKVPAETFKGFIKHLFDSECIIRSIATLNRTMDIIEYPVKFKGLEFSFIIGYSVLSDEDFAHDIKVNQDLTKYKSDIKPSETHHDEIYE